MTGAELAEKGGGAALIEATLAACVKPNLPSAEAVAGGVVSTLRDIRPGNKREPIVAAKWSSPIGRRWRTTAAPDDGRNLLQSREQVE
jgi:hypothetical protein